MNPEKLQDELERKEESYEGQELKEEVETLLTESSIDYTQTRVGGLEQPKHKSYEYEIDLGDNIYDLEIILWDGRPGHKDGSVNLERI